jgi:DNA mismatch endonuclease (patch repair protein)
MDTLTTLQRSQRMASIRSKNTKPELIVRGLVFALGHRYRLHSRDLPGSPDLVFRSRKKVIFVHGCFWHGHRGCKTANKPKSRTQYWDEKFTRNKQRDARNQRALKALGWRSLVVWECELKDSVSLRRRLRIFLGPIKPAL